MPPQLIPNALRDRIVSELIASFKGLPGWKGVAAGQYTPVYDADGSQAYYEVTLKDAAGGDAGYALIAATEDELPILEFSETAKAPSQRLAMKVGNPNFKMVYFGPGYISAEDANGKLLAGIGDQPTAIPLEGRVANRGEGGTAVGAAPRLPRPAIPRNRIRRATNAWTYAQLKTTFARPRPARDRVKLMWDAIKSPNSPFQCTETWAAVPNGHAYFLQIPKNTPPNNNDHWSGCGATAWLNLYGWHDLNFSPKLLQGSPKTNTAYIKGLTMQVHDYVGTYEPWWTFGADGGFTWPEDMSRGFEFARGRLLHSCGYWYRYDWWNTDEEWVFKVAREAIQHKRPFIVGYFSDRHYAIGYGIRECKGTVAGIPVTFHFMRIYPGWSGDDSDDKWIGKSTIFGAWLAYDFSPLPAGSVGPEVVRYDWSSGWSSAEFYEVNNVTYLFTLKAGDGTVHVNAMNNDGTVGARVDTRDWSSGWTHARPFRVGGTQFLFFLKYSTGDASIHQVNANGSIGPEVASYDWSSGWSTAEFFEIGGATYLFTLKISGGTVHVNRMNANGTVGPRVDTRDWSDGWTDARFYRVGANLFLLMLKSASGVAHISKINNDGTIGADVTQYDWSSGWTTAEFYQVGGATYLFTLKASGGAVHVNRINNDGSVGTRIDERNWSDGWTTARFYPATAANQAFLLLLKLTTGEAHIHKVNS